MKTFNPLLMVLMACILMGCKDSASVHAINYSQIRNTDGYVQAIGENKPFTGVVANIPYHEIDLTLKIAYALTVTNNIAGFIPGQVLPTKGYCAVSFHNGNVEGSFFCDDTPVNTDEKVRFDPDMHRVTGTLSNDQLTNTLSLRNKEGVTIYQVQLLDGKRHGQYIQKYDDGTLKAAISYSNGKLNGPFEAYYSNGLAHLTAQYIHGVQEGWLHLYFDNGFKNISERYENGALVERINYYKGRDQISVHYIAPKDGSSRAQYAVYYENGDVKEQGWVLLGPVSSYHFEDGVEKMGFQPGISEISYFDENGIKTHTITRGVRPESRIEYAPNGQKSAFYTLSGEKEHGPYELYYPDGRIREKGEMYYGDKEEELLEIYDENGQPGDTPRQRLLQRISTGSANFDDLIWSRVSDAYIFRDRINEQTYTGSIHLMPLSIFINAGGKNFNGFLNLLGRIPLAHAEYEMLSNLSSMDDYDGSCSVHAENGVLQGEFTCLIEGQSYVMKGFVGGGRLVDQLEILDTGHERASVVARARFGSNQYDIAVQYLDPNTQEVLGESQSGYRSPPPKEVRRSDMVFEGGQWLDNGQPFTGVVTEIPYSDIIDFDLGEKLDGILESDFDIPKYEYLGFALLLENVQNASCQMGVNRGAAVGFRCKGGSTYEVSGEIENGQLNGVFKIEHTIFATTTIEANYVAGVLDGEFKYTHPRTEIKLATGQFHNGKPVGQFIANTRNGRVFMRVQYNAEGQRTCTNEQCD
ncbi:hypothetical protein CUZ56_01193 [Saezia sanguinis]|uniref:Antitoxin YwqK n=1 Tax=Saezia sanguinis TaxID=1965230 RepID=A0A433SEU5_9BURK|nr:hypothetical protein [Saezia sanguinis]RUS67250.1 hypothetical protein CUZ56_01193 [Saezia sanguinis]